MKKIILLACLVLSAHWLHGQSINIEFTHFSGQEWTLTAYRGETVDTIATGRLDAAGKSNIKLPEQYKTNPGFLLWMLRSGTGIGVIAANGENVKVSCSEIQPSVENIIYSNTVENNFLSGHYQLQEEILQKMEAMHMATQSYRNDSTLLPTFTHELRNQEQNYMRFQQQTGVTPLYAARIAQFANVARGLPPVISPDHQENAKQLNSFITNNLNIETLFTSGYWHPVLTQWLEWYTLPQNETKLIADYQKLKEGITDKKIASTFEETAQNILKGKSRKDLTLLIGNRKAPELTQTTLSGKKTILAFYASGCGPCEAQMEQLKGNYALLKEKGYEVISISADEDKGIFQTTAAGIPWKHNYCDLKGLNGKDFQNYGVSGTPTFFVMDERGTINGIYSQVEKIKSDLQQTEVILHASSE